MIGSASGYLGFFIVILNLKHSPTIKVSSIITSTGVSSSS
jgi:hypothetical protein